MPMAITRTLGWLVALGALGAWAYQSWIAQPETQQQRTTERHAEASQRFQNWAYVAKEKEVAPGETVKLIIIPHSSGADFLDTKCLIYTHREFKASSMLCPDARQDDIEVTDER